MAEITPQMVKELREKTGAGIMDCKKALQECQGDLEKAVESLRKKGLATAVKKASRATNEGLIHSYIHMGGKIGVLIEVNCETDFVARTEEFKELVHNLAMQVAASSPLYVSKEDVPEDALEKERRLYREQALEQGKPEKVIDRIVEGKLNKFYQEVCLLEQPFIREPEKTVSQLITEHIAKLGENIRVKRFVRFQLGEE
ncbi:MAG: elongation factor Ts [Aquificota bacterium]|nr:MAG: elongation factor Ts [Aquificota bacterium]